MKIIDCFTFFSIAELDLLEIRLRYLSPVVDLFVICESDHTHAGNPKPYILQENWERFKPFHDKIIYLQIEQSTEGLTFDKNLTKYTDTDGAWVLEQQQRQALALINDQVDDYDVVLVGDLDEIPMRHRLKNTKEKYILPPRTIPMNFYAYYLNNRNVEGPDVIWAGTVISRGIIFKEYGPQGLRDRRNEFMPSVTQGFQAHGNHFSYMGGLEAIKNKIRSFAHTEFSHVADNDESILRAIEAGEDVLGRPGVKYQLQHREFFQKDLSDIILDYPHLIK